MRRMFMIVLGGGIVVLALGFLALGAFPPHLQPHAVQKVIPTDKLGGA
jgi:hypothetical protein